MSDSPFLMVPEVARLLRVPTSRVYEWTRTRAAPCYKPGKAILFDRDEIEAWFRKTQRLEAPSPFSRRLRRVPARARRRAPDRTSEGQQAKRAGRTRLPANRRRPVALAVPGDGPAAVGEDHAG